MKYVFTIILMLLLSASIGVANISATKHERIYKSIDKKELKVIILANKDLNNDEICRRKKDGIWNAAMSVVKTMLEQQNQWDNLDINNISEHRINVDRKLLELEYEFRNGYMCECL